MRLNLKTKQSHKTAEVPLRQSSCFSKKNQVTGRNASAIAKILRKFVAHFNARHNQG